MTTHPWHDKNQIAAVLVFVLLLLGSCRGQFDSCPLRARLACEAICQRCESINGNPVCSGTTTGNECVSPCLNQDVSFSNTLVPTAVTTRPCAYYEVLNTPHEEVITPKCADVENELACDILGGVFEHQTGAVGETCGVFPFLSTVVSGSPCCPETTSPFLLGSTQLCVSNDTSYVGPTLTGTIPVCSIGVCSERNASVIPGEGLVFPTPTFTATCTESCTPSCTPINTTACDAGCTPFCTAACTTEPEATCQASCEATCVASCTPVDATTCTPSCTPFCTASATSTYDWEICPGCSQIIGDPCPTSCAGPGCFDFTAPPSPPVLVSVADVTVVPGLCVAGVCTGTLNTSIVGSNTAGEPCAAGACQTAFTDPDIDLTDPDNYPTPTCNPTCPGFPSCTGPCPGWPNLADVFNLTRTIVADVDLPDGEECRSADACVESAVCVSSVCTPTSSRGPVCERYTCRECAPANGTCFGPPLPAGTPCKRGCIVDDLGVCDGAGQCIGTPVEDSFCREELGSGVPENPIDDPCFDIVCTPSFIPYIAATSRSNVITYRAGGVPLTPAFIDPQVLGEDLDGVVVGLVGEFSQCSLNATLAMCDDNDACTQGDHCNANFICAPTTETRSSCGAALCAKCNPLTGACEGIVDVPTPCTSECGLPGLPGGFCDTMTGICTPDFPDATVCQLSSEAAECNIATCASVYSGAQIAIPVGQVIPPTSILAFSSAVCSLIERPDGTVCESSQALEDDCIISEECQNGECVVVQEVDCTGVFSDNACVSQNSAECSSITGQCVFDALPPNTPCSTGNLCLEEERCFSDGVNEPVCLGTPAIDCAAVAAANPCIITSVCQVIGQTPQCINSFAIDGTSCAVPNPGLCAPQGTCSSGVCIPVPTQCPASTQQCQVSFCNPGTGICGFQNAADGSNCDDNSFCTSGDQCLSGMCVGTPLDCTPPECKISQGCSEQTASCVFTDQPDGTPCTDGSCQGGTCVLECDPPCQAGGVCTAVNPVTCTCPPSRAGQFCEIEAEDAMNDLSVLIDNTFTSLLGVLAQFFVYLLLVAIVLTYYLVCVREASTINALVIDEKKDV